MKFHLDDSRNFPFAIQRNCFCMPRNLEVKHVPCCNVFIIIFILQIVLVNVFLSFRVRMVSIIEDKKSSILIISNFHYTFTDLTTIRLLRALKLTWLLKKTGVSLWGEHLEWNVFFNKFQHDVLQFKCFWGYKLERVFS